MNTKMVLCPLSHSTHQACLFHTHRKVKYLAARTLSSHIIITSHRLGHKDTSQHCSLNLLITRPLFPLHLITRPHSPHFTSSQDHILPTTPHHKTTFSPLHLITRPHSSHYTSSQDHTLPLHLITKTTFSPLHLVTRPHSSPYTSSRDHTLPTTPPHHKATPTTTQESVPVHTCRESRPSRCHNSCTRQKPPLEAPPGPPLVRMGKKNQLNAILARQHNPLEGLSLTTAKIKEHIRLLELRLLDYLLHQLKGSLPIHLEQNRGGGGGGGGESDSMNLIPDAAPV